MPSSRSSSRYICSCGNPSCKKYAQVKKKDSNKEPEKKVYYVCRCKGGECGCYYRKEGDTAWKPMKVKPHSNKKPKPSVSTHKSHHSHHSSHKSHSCECHGSRCKCSRVHENHGHNSVMLDKQTSMIVYPRTASAMPYSHYGWYSGCACRGHHCNC